MTVDSYFKVTRKIITGADVPAPSLVPDSLFYPYEYTM